MTFKVTRKKLVIISIGIILIFYLINRLNVIINSDFADAQVVGEKIQCNQDSTHCETIIVYIGFTYNNSYYICESEKSEIYPIGEELTVIIKNKDPHNASSFRFAGFWLNSLLYTLLPIMVIAALILAFIKENAVFIINLGKNNKKHATQKNDEYIGLDKL